MQLLRHLTFPATARLSISTFDVHTGSLLPPLLMPLCRHLQDPRAPLLRLLQMHCPGIRATIPSAQLMLTAYKDRSLLNPRNHNADAVFHILSVPTPDHNQSLTCAPGRAYNTSTLQTVYLKLDAGTTNLTMALMHMVESPRPAECRPPIRALHLDAFVSSYYSTMAREDAAGT
ncbi:hypothetical protein C8R44DRAFT_866052 [Mycena epipterygia]|nr:hypothetical protein C8R44DRAFT_866052 [Mycena epipterygia]